MDHMAMVAAHQVLERLHRQVGVHDTDDVLLHQQRRQSHRLLYF